MRWTPGNERRKRIGVVVAATRAGCSASAPRRLLRAGCSIELEQLQPLYLGLIADPPDGPPSQCNNFLNCDFRPLRISRRSRLTLA